MFTLPELENITNSLYNILNDYHADFNLAALEQMIPESYREQFLNSFNCWFNEACAVGYKEMNKYESTLKILTDTIYHFEQIKDVEYGHVSSYYS